MMAKNQVRFKQMRILADNLKSVRKGWKVKTSSTQAIKEWQECARFDTKIRWREELGEINENRIHNMERCADRIHGLILRPGQAFSLRKSIGDPIPANGFLDGPTIINGQLSYTSGGGICQVSTTLFNLALAANLEILEKHNHSSDIWGENRFIDLGRDAVFVYARMDLKFRNPHNLPIQLKIWTDRPNLALCSAVIAPETNMPSVHIRTEILEEIPPLQANGKKGWRVLTERNIEGNTGSTEVNYSQESYYKPVG